MRRPPKRAPKVIPNRKPHDAYFTRDTWLIELALDHLALPDGVVWEPACGAGHLCRALEARGRTTFASDIRDWGWPCEVRDFFAYREAPPGVRTIFTNPPYRRGVALPFVRHALSLMAPVGGTVVMLLAHDWMTAGDRPDLFTDAGPFDRVLIPTRRPLWFDPPAVAGEAQDRPKKNYDWYVWSPAGIGRPGYAQVVRA